MKKFRTVLLPLLMSITLLTGCSSDLITNITTLANNLQSNTASVETTAYADEARPTLLSNRSSGNSADEDSADEEEHFDLSDVEEFSGDPYVVVNDNEPFFSDEAKLNALYSYEYYQDLDELGRCGAAVANVGQDIMPTEERGSIGSVKPSGWHTVKYDCVDGKYLYNRCHLIGYQLAGENANEKNLITGTRYLNIEGMLPFEDMIADYVNETDNHVLYRVTPIFEGDNLVATGVLMEAYSVEDEGDGVCFNVFCYNAQPGITIDYATGDSTLGSDVPAETEDETESQTTTDDYSGYTYILNTNSKKVHLPGCSSVSKMADKNKQGSNESESELIAEGYTPCGKCHPFGEDYASSTSSSGSTENTTTVYVSNSGKIHSRSNCSGMKHYTEMTYDQAIAAGYTLCKKCY